LSQEVTPFLFPPDRRLYVRMFITIEAVSLGSFLPSLLLPLPVRHSLILL
jgi:hypothetical protein